MKRIILILICINLSIVVFSSNLMKGTIVTLADGTEVSIEEVRVGDTLLTLDVKNNNILVSQVLKINQATQQAFKAVVLADGSELFLTPDHLIWSDKGWVAFDKESSNKQDKYADEKISSYKVDSFIYTIDSNFNIAVLPIIEIRDHNVEGKSYNLELDNKDAAFIANSLFVGQ